MLSKQALHIVGAGPAGLAAAITAARAGREVVVHEMASDVGHRFHDDFQGLENWSTKVDVMDELGALGIEPRWEHIPVSELVCFGPDGSEHVLRSQRPFYYLVRRGPGPGTVDNALKRLALEKGVQIRWGDRIQRLPEGGIVTQGPRGANAMAVGWIFKTDLADGSFAVVNKKLAPGGYAYLLVNGGRATLATCMFHDFHNEKLYLERAVNFFKDRVGVRMDNPRRFGGVGNMWVPDTAVHGRILLAGESAGFQDPLWGFGIRYALLSGHLAARAWNEGRPESYDALWRERLGGLLRAGMVNRFLYRRSGTPGYRFLFWNLTRSGGTWNWLYRNYQLSVWRRILFPVARRYAFFSHVDRSVCESPTCECTWCRCVRELRADSRVIIEGKRQPKDKKETDSD